jgi:hypothetical protein
MKFIIALLLLASCNDFTERNEIPKSNFSGTATYDGTFTNERLIGNLGVYIITPTVEKLNKNINELNFDYLNFCNSLNDYENDNFDIETLNSLLEPIQASWKQSMQSYHIFAMMNVGPSAAETSSIMPSIYSFDQQDKCRLDQAVVLYDLRDRLPRFDVIDNYNVRGLDSIERFLFGSQESTICKRNNSRLDQYYAKPLLERTKKSCGFGQHLFTDIVEKSSELQKAWSTSEGYYTKKLLRGSEGTEIEVVNKISQALFFLDTNTKDLKLAYPAGFEVNIDNQVQKCVGASCPQNREHPYANFSLEAILASVKGFKSLFFGINLENNIKGYGLDDLLTSRGHKDIADELGANLDTLIAKLEIQVEKTTLKELLEQITINDCEASSSKNRINEACALVWDIRKVTDILKNEYLAALSEFNAPKQAQGDND